MMAINSQSVKKNMTKASVHAKTLRALMSCKLSEIKRIRKMSEQDSTDYTIGF